ncbi:MULTISPECIES: ribosome maturation factor RimP [Mycobacteriaceae]|uniref:Ribosome maturation factor RimP n=1 Tax=Mycolicibacterium neoaurum VKM Ac-1815D TaxID=700508 RepID=V5XBW7_MYCNE|nr:MULTISPECIES: ribosome maturation factor RimP [Mycobacteriaceae]AHC25161.1 ribosome maturation protein RimP [Mycolicibacterium neoaurum VKM Ac-1815D]AMO05659.1 ribosome maturation protein RimP [Mycolicibacterium neoaurum]AXK76016.1 ribosome maturation factor RimP [Mycolicibacterium neoaurum]KJQ49491.1 ribosome maturation protein RimP [Mycolicibacterium neoaurum]KUM09130.1 ribosome maturation factor RimP [Mycolicibacterium neoaurum]
MATDDPLRSARLPSREQVIELLTGEFSRAGYEIEDVTITAARPPSITVVADGDAPLDLDAVAELSRLASAALDEADRGFDPYVLEVTSRGVDRPLTEEKHFRRAKGRKVGVTLVDGSVVTGRIGATRDGMVALVVAEGKNLVLRPVAVDEIVKAIVQVEFSTPNRRELELVEQSEEGAGS